MRRFEQEDVVELMKALGAVWPQLWKGRGRELLGPVAYVDVDGTVAPTQGEKKAGTDMSYMGVWGYHPLVTSLANTGEVLYLVNRPGNVPSHTGAGEWIGRSIDLVAPHVERGSRAADTEFKSGAVAEYAPASIPASAEDSVDRGREHHRRTVVDVEPRGETYMPAIPSIRYRFPAIPVLWNQIWPNGKCGRSCSPG